MDIGNFFRESYEKNVIAQYGVEEITHRRANLASPTFEKLDIDPKDSKKRIYNGESITLLEFATELYTPERTIYILDQLKNPDEVSLLRSIYGQIFYMIGVLGNSKERQRTLQNNMTSSEAETLIERDKSEDKDHGQQLEKTLQFADYFIMGTGVDNPHLEDNIKRLIDLIHGAKVITPTKDEYGMYIAYSASLKSACLSRQVGASISDESGKIISTGCNDVPKYGGGLYENDGIKGEKDFRCFNMPSPICYNDRYKKAEIKDKIFKKISKIEAIKDPEKLTEEIFSGTRIKDLIEFSRAIHAEMDAIIGLARRGGPSTRDSILYTTTFPCHNCARHIVAAGIKKVIFIQPYEKSLATELHSDAITTDINAKEDKVKFIHFEGVAPKKYQYFFEAHESRKDSSGKMISKEEYPALKVSNYLDDYRVIEVKVTAAFKQSGPESS